MHPTSETTTPCHPAAPMQFGLVELLEFVTLCAVILASSRWMGMIAGGCLILLAFFLWARRGEFALAAMMAATFAGEMETAVAGNDVGGGAGFEAGRLLLVIGHVAAISAWYHVRRLMMNRTLPRDD